MKKKLTASIGMLALIFSLSTSVFAESSKSDEGVMAAATVEASMVQDGEAISISFASSTFDFDSFVTKGIITADEKLKIEKYIESKLEETKKEFEKLETMTDEERETYFESNENQKVNMNIFDNLLEEGLLSQTQLDEIEAYQEEERLLDVEKRTKEETASYVSESLITQDEKTAIDELAIIKYKEMAQEISEFATNVKNLTEEEREAFLNSNDTSKLTKISSVASSISELALENNIITEEQHDKINEYNKTQMILTISEDIKESTTKYLNEGIINAEEKTNIDNYLIEKNSNFEKEIGNGEMTISIPAIKTETKADAPNKMITVKGESDEIRFASSFFMDLDGLVKNNIITTEQANKIQELNSAYMGDFSAISITALAKI